jgi:hypothetical protein
VGWGYGGDVGFRSVIAVVGLGVWAGGVELINWVLYSLTKKVSSKYKN